MDRQRWARMRQLFDAAVTLPSAEQEAWLAQACSDVVLRAEVRAMLDGDRVAASRDMLPGRVSEFIAQYSPRAVRRRTGSG